jgi:glutathione S-transferase
MNQPIKLYRHALSGHSHRVELFLSLLGLPFTTIDVDVIQRAHKEPAFLAKNPLGQVPVIEDGDVTLSDSNAILVYLALRYDGARDYYPSDPVAAAEVQRWLSVAAGELANGPGLLRVSQLFRRPIDRTRPEALAMQLFSVLEAKLARQPWLVGTRPTLADVALYTYTAHAPEGGVSLEAYSALRSWLARIEALPNFVPMQRVALATPTQAG